MPDDKLELRCQRCGTPMDLRDPAPGTPWAAQQFWVCPSCGRHFWTTHAQPPGAKPAAEAKPAADAAKPAASRPPAAAKPAATASPAPSEPTPAS